ncbi:MAG: RluA family pseudouridine synthase [Bradymonadia bacterium]
MHETESEWGHGGAFMLPGHDSPVPGWLLQVPPDQSRIRVDAFVCARVPRLSRSRASRLTFLEHPSGKRLKKSALVSPGQHILAIRPIPDVDAVIAQKPAVLWENNEWCVINKPPMIATHPSASYFKRTVTYWLRTQGYTHIQTTHRLDVETSGLLLCGKTPEAVRLASDAFSSQTVEKSYLAILDGIASKDHWCVDTPLGFDETSRIPIKMGVGTLAASTRFEVLARGDCYSLVHARPHGGRQHQIRVHASLSGLPLVGDKLYGPDEDFFVHRHTELDAEKLARLGHWRHALHAMRLSTDFLPKVFEIGPPQDWFEIKGIAPILSECFGNNLP